MKKFIIIIFTIIASVILFDFAFYRWGFYIPSNKETKVISYTDDNNMYILKNGKYESITVKGVNIGGSIPGTYVTDYRVSYDTYYSWLESIGEMNANTVRLNTIFQDDFYKAFYDYNNSHEKKLYLIQGINLDSYDLNSHVDGFDRSFYGELITQAENAVDVVHGRKKISLSSHGKGSFKKDISEYLLGYLVGSEWISDTIIYTNNLQSSKKGYNGNFIQTGEEASAFETMLAKVMDHLVTYETNKYREQHAISFINTPETDPIGDIPTVIKDSSHENEYILLPETLKYNYYKMVKLDIDHLNSKKGFKGLYASYNVSSYYPNYLNYTKETYEDIYYSYLEKLTAYHKVPVLITEYGYSTSRGIASLANDKYGNYGGMTEEEQGTALIEAYHTILKSNAVGGIISNWQDEWDKRTFNTIEKVNTTHSLYWSDTQTASQGNGILTFDPGKDRSVSYVDGNAEEWMEEDKILDNKDLSLSVKQDEKYLYLYVNKKKNLDNTLYIPIDTTSKSGTKYASYYDLNFNRDVDFLMVLNGNEGEIFVQEYYNVLNAVDGYEVYNKNSYIEKPQKDSNTFQPIELLIEPFSTNMLSKNYNHATLINTGKLTFGNGNPLSKDFNSQADYYELNGKVEIRIPWQILNFSDPALMLIHDDYYEKYGVESYPISEIFIGASTSKTIDLGSYKLESWNNTVTYHERLKKSYYMVKEDWGK